MTQESLRLPVAAQVAVQVVSIGLLAVLAGQDIFPEFRLVSDLVRCAAGCGLVLVALDLVAVVRGDFDKLSLDHAPTIGPRAKPGVPAAFAAPPLPQVPRGQRMAAAHRQRFRSTHGA
ncbi:hypothetical protein [Variovorax sp. dw_308]|uniref:hypothetical protein n=1 Tax=Variovorax sp. dw_308 TaxID=2721546 RepID=UPI001C45E7AA|nr:hypothetical protein [Variovorax sp. dw_308]